MLSHREPRMQMQLPPRPLACTPVGLDELLGAGLVVRHSGSARRMKQGHDWSAAPTDGASEAPPIEALPSLHAIIAWCRGFYIRLDEL